LLAIYQKVLGPEHPCAATSLSNLGRVLRDLGQTDKAEPLFLWAIAIGDKALGAQHAVTSRYQSHYARLLLISGQAPEGFGARRGSYFVPRPPVLAS